MMKESVQEFIDREVWPYKERFEKRFRGIHKTVYAKSWRAWLPRCIRSRRIWRNGHGLVSTMLVGDYISGATGIFQQHLEPTRALNNATPFLWN